MCGISYLGMACYWAAMQQPPHLAAIVPYEAQTNMYEDSTRQGGVWHAGFQKHWFNNVVLPQQYGRKEGLDESQLRKQRFDFEILHKEWQWRSEGPWPILERERQVSKIQVPLLTAGNWMDSEVHLPGNARSFEESSSKWKFLEMHTGNHLSAYYEKSQIDRQLQFLDYFLKGKVDNGLESAPRIDLLIRRGTENFYRVEKSWPPQDAVLTPLYLAPKDRLSFEPYTASSQDDAIEYAGLTGKGHLFQTDVLDADFEILGYPFLDLTVSTDAKDMDIFIYFYIIDPSGAKIEVRGNHDEPAVSLLRGWQRLTHRTLSKDSRPDRPILEQLKPAPVKKNEWYNVTIPMPCTSLLVPKGHRFAVALQATDEEEIIPPMRHNGPDRSEAVFAGTNRIRLGGKVIVPHVKR